MFFRDKYNMVSHFSYGLSIFNNTACNKLKQLSLNLLQRDVQLPYTETKFQDIVQGGFLYSEISVARISVVKFPIQN